MCGIAGYFGPRPPDVQTIRSTLSLMERRGPDDYGQCTLEAGHNKLSFLHTRLSIIDLDHRAAQPFVRNGLTLIFNGEIYNYIELRRQLVDFGYNFTTSSDTEVVINAYLEWGVSCFDKFEGMFAIAIYDDNNATLTLARDAFGEKPLYTYFDGRALYFASQIQFLHELGAPHLGINMDRLQRLLAHSGRGLYKVDDTYFIGIREFPPAHFAQMTLPTIPKPERYWELTYRPQKMSLEEAKEGAKEHFYNSLKIRLRSDVPIALTLSGGIDSNVLAGVAIKEFGCDMHAFSMVEEDIKFNELDYINTAATDLDCPLHLKKIESTHFLKRLEKLTQYFDAPITAIGMYLDGYLAESVKEAGYKVAINGIGADELFTGYYDHYLYWLAGQKNQPGFDQLIDDWQNSQGKSVRNPYFKDPERFVKTPHDRQYLYENTPDIDDFMKVPINRRNLEHPFCDDLLRCRLLNEINHEAVPIYMHDGDLNWMYHSIENRTAYLDKSLANFMFNVPNEHLIKDGYSKFLLRSIGEGLVHPDILYLKHKTGFNAPMDSLLDLTNSETQDFLFADSAIFNIVDRNAMEELLRPGKSMAGYDNFAFVFTTIQMFLHTHK